MDKEELRRQALKKRDLLSISEIEEKSRRIFERVTELHEYKEAADILVYASMRSEVRTDEMILDALSLGKKVFCPKVTDKANGVMEFVRIHSLEELFEGYFGIREPVLDDKSEIYRDSSDKTFAIIPGVAYDRDKNRIGYGGGFYDRFLGKFSEIETVSVCFDCQITDNAIDKELYDVKPKRLISESFVL